jgi:hypothetical protein
MCLAHPSTSLPRCLGETTATGSDVSLNSEIVVAVWCDERSSLPLQSRPISAWFYLSAAAASTTYSGELNATQIPSPVRFKREADSSPLAPPESAVQDGKDACADEVDFIAERVGRRARRAPSPSRAHPAYPAFHADHRRTGAARSTQDRRPRASRRRQPSATSAPEPATRVAQL